MTTLSRPVGAIGPIVGAALLVGLGPAPGWAGDPFAVTVVVANLDSPDAAAREAAVAQAESTGLAAVLQRLTATRDHGRLPPAEGPNVAGYIRAVTPLGDGGRVVVAARPDAVRQLLDAFGIAFIEEPAPLLAVVPVYQGDAGPVLWSGTNPWLDAWQVYDGPGGLAPVAVPFGEFGDLDALSTQEALDGNPAALRALALRYQAAGTLVAVYAERGGEAEVRLSVSADDWQGTTSLILPAATPIAPASLDAAVAALERLWVERQNTPSYDGPLSVSEATAVYASLADWIAIRRALDQAPIVARYDVPVLGGQSARIVLHHYADLATLQQDLAGAGLAVERAGFTPTGQPALSLRLTGAAPQPAEPVPPDLHAPPTGAPAWGDAPQPPSLTVAPQIPSLRFDP